jgi:hypothetical protein
VIGDSPSSLLQRLVDLSSKTLINSHEEGKHNSNRTLTSSLEGDKALSSKIPTSRHLDKASRDTSLMPSLHSSKILPPKQNRPSQTNKQMIDRPKRVNRLERSKPHQALFPKSPLLRMAANRGLEDSWKTSENSSS